MAHDKSRLHVVNFFGQEGICLLELYCIYTSSSGTDYAQQKTCSESCWLMFDGLEAFHLPHKCYFSGIFLYFASKRWNTIAMGLFSMN